jgi:uncharacterized membrane protein
MYGFMAPIEALFIGNNGWIPWNLALACLPLALSMGLFRDSWQGRSWLWWLWWAVFLALLPNAPYLLTDIVHLISTIRAGLSVWLLTLAVFPVHLGAMLGGFEAYVVAVMRQGRYVRRHGAPHLVVWTELITHALCAVGIYLGRFQGFNSWDLLVNPGQVLRSATQAMTASRPLGVIGVTFVILTLGYWCMKQLTLGMLWRLRAVHISCEHCA